jgi:GNAT superfamily N-acetyltransferase
MIITGEDVLSKEPAARERHLRRITELVRIADPDAQQLEIAHLQEINASGTVAFYCVEETIVGCGRLLVFLRLKATREGALESLIVDPAFRRRGIARELVEYRISQARKRKLSRVAVLTLPDNIKIHTLYRNLGFKEFERKRFRLDL